MVSFKSLLLIVLILGIGAYALNEDYRERVSNFKDTISDFISGNKPPTPQNYTVARISFVDMSGKRYQKNDLKIKVVDENKSTVFEGYTDANGEIRVENVWTVLPYKITIEEGFSTARVYPLNESFSFVTNAQSFTIERRAELLPIKMEYNGEDYGSIVELPSGDDFLFIFDIKSRGEGIVKEPRFIVRTNGTFEKFNAWLWPEHDTGLGIPPDLVSDNIEFNKEYSFENNIDSNHYGSYVFQVDRVSEGEFELCIEDSVGLEKQCVKFRFL